MSLRLLRLTNDSTSIWPVRPLVSLKVIHGGQLGDDHLVTTLIVSQFKQNKLPTIFDSFFTHVHNIHTRNMK